MELVCLRKTFVNLDNWRKNTIVDYGREGTNENKLKSLQVAKWRKDEWRMNEGWMRNDEGWMLNDEEWWFQAVEGFCFLTDGRTDRRTDIGACRVAFATENWHPYNDVFVQRLIVSVTVSWLLDFMFSSRKHQPLTKFKSINCSSQKPYCQRKSNYYYLDATTAQKYG